MASHRSSMAAARETRIGFEMRLELSKSPIPSTPQSVKEVHQRKLPAFEDVWRPKNQAHSDFKKEQTRLLSRRQTSPVEQISHLHTGLSPGSGGKIWQGREREALTSRKFTICQCMRNDVPSAERQQHDRAKPHGSISSSCRIAVGGDAPSQLWAIMGNVTSSLPPKLAGSLSFLASQSCFDQDITDLL
eukprot:3588804-Rhodomonas_salina.1